MQAEAAGVDVGSERIDIVEHQIFQLRSIRQHLSQRPVSQHVGDFIPMADRVHTLCRQIVGVVRRFSGGACPVHQCGPETDPHFFFLLIEDLLSNFFPGKLQVTQCRNHAEAD